MGGTPAAVEQRVVTADRPKVRIGDTCEFACTRGSENSERARAIESVDRAAVKDTGYGHTLAWTDERNEIASPRHKVTDNRLLRFALVVGKQGNGLDQWLN